MLETMVDIRSKRTVQRIQVHPRNTKTEYRLRISHCITFGPMNLINSVIRNCQQKTSELLMKRDYKTLKKKRMMPTFHQVRKSIEQGW
jgi:hypothetical protein